MGKKLGRQAQQCTRCKAQVHFSTEWWPTASTSRCDMLDLSWWNWRRWQAGCTKLCMQMTWCWLGAYLVPHEIRVNENHWTDASYVHWQGRAKGRWRWKYICSNCGLTVQVFARTSRNCPILFETRNMVRWVVIIGGSFIIKLIVRLQAINYIIKPFQKYTLKLHRIFSPM